MIEPSVPSRQFNSEQLQESTNQNMNGLKHSLQCQYFNFNHPTEAIICWLISPRLPLSGRKSTWLGNCMVQRGLLQFRVLPMHWIQHSCCIPHQLKNSDRWGPGREPHPFETFPFLPRSEMSPHSPDILERFGIMALLSLLGTHRGACSGAGQCPERHPAAFYLNVNVEFQSLQPLFKFYILFMF